MDHFKDRSGTDKPGETLRRKSLGRAGEIVARIHLENLGFRILERNFRKRGGEIDIIAYKDRTIVFCEVKTTKRNTENTSKIIEGYSITQRQRLVTTSELYLAENIDLLPAEFDLRYDLIIVGGEPGGELEIIDHIPDAFSPE